MAVTEADCIPIELFDALHVACDDVRDILLPVRGALVTNTRGDAFREKVEGRLRPDAFVSGVAQSQPGFYKNIRELLRTGGITSDPPGVARNSALTSNVIRTIWPTAGQAITDSYRRIKRSQPRDSSRPSLQDLLQRTPSNRDPVDRDEVVFSVCHPSADTREVVRTNREDPKP